MYVRMVDFQTDASKKEEALKIMDTIMPKIKSLPGCKDCMFITHDDDGSYALLVFWETQQNADMVAPIIGPLLIPRLDKIARNPVNPRLFEVYEPAVQLS